MSDEQEMTRIASPSRGRAGNETEWALREEVSRLLAALDRRAETDRVTGMLMVSLDKSHQEARELLCRWSEDLDTPVPEVCEAVAQVLGHPVGDPPSAIVEAVAALMGRVPRVGSGAWSYDRVTKSPRSSQMPTVVR